MSAGMDAVRRQYEYTLRHPGADFHHACEHEPRPWCDPDGSGNVTVKGNDLQDLMNRLCMGDGGFAGDPEFAAVQWRAEGRNVYAGDVLIGVMAVPEQASARCAEQSGRLAGRNGLTAPLDPAKAARQAGV